MGTPSITIFSIPKGFTDPHTKLIQENALQSWVAIPGSQVLLLGNDPGVREEAGAFGATHIPEVALTEYGTPLLDSAFALAERHAAAPLLMYTNGDIVFPNNLPEILKKLPAGPFLAVGRRTNLDIAPGENFELIRERASTDGVLHSWAGIDYFIFRKGAIFPLPPLVVGRVGWDNWMIAEARRRRIPVIDLTEVLQVIHQNHPPTRGNERAARKTNPEALTNKQYLKGKADTYTIEDADWRLTKNGLKQNHLYFVPFLKRFVKEKLGI